MAIVISFKEKDLLEVLQRVYDGVIIHKPASISSLSAEEMDALQYAYANGLIENIELHVSRGSLGVSYVNITKPIGLSIHGVAEYKRLSENKQIGFRM